MIVQSSIVYKHLHIKLYTRFYKWISGVEGIWRGSTFVLGWLGIGPHKLPGLDEVMLGHKGTVSISLAKTVLCGEVPYPTRGDPVDAEQYGSRPEGQ